MRLSVIIPVRRDPRLARCLDALVSQTLPRSRFEVIVVDDDGNEDTARIAERASAHCIVQPGGGSYAARQRGAGESRAEILAFTDADCEPPPDWLARIDRLFEDPTCLVVTGPSDAANRGPVADWVQAIDEERWQSLLKVEPIAFCDTRNLAIRREVLAAVPFDASFRQAGDIDLGIRLFAKLDRKHGRRARPTGQRPLRIGRLDLKAALLHWSGQPGFRLVAIPLVALALVPPLAALSVLALVPSGAASGRRLFVVFERLSLLLGRLVG